jgi:hypothetical protein
MSTENYDSEFPIHIDLGTKRPDYAIQAGEDSPKKGKDKMDYPTLYIRGVKELADLPKEGCALIEFKRIKLSSITPEDGESGEDAELSVRVLCLPEQQEDNAGDIKDVLTKAAKEAGIDTGDEAGESDEDDDNEKTE